MKQAHCIYQNDDHRWLAIARDASKPGYLIDTNEYLVMDGEQALLCDPCAEAHFGKTVEQYRAEHPIGT